MAEANPKERQRWGGDPMVVLNVGTPSTPFYIHRSRLCDASPVFRAAFLGTGAFRESESRSMDLEEDDAAVFEVIAPWLYTKTIELSEDTPNDTEYIARLATFTDWTLSRPTSESLADAGFVYEPGDGYVFPELQSQSGNADSEIIISAIDIVRCPHCTQRLSEWGAQHSPLTQHLIFKPDCQFAQKAKEALQPTSDKGESESHMRLVNVYAAAEKYAMVDLKNDLIDLLFRLKRAEPKLKPPPCAAISYSYNCTPRRSPLRKLLVAWYTWHVDKEWYGYETTPDMLSEVPDFAVDLLCSMGQKIDKASPFDGKSDVYHELILVPDSHGGLNLMES